MKIDNPIVSGSLIVNGSTIITGILSASSFIGDGSGLIGVTSYTDSDTLDYINSRGVVSGSSQIFPYTGSMKISGSIETQGSIYITKGVIINPSTLETNITIPSNYNGLLIGPISNPNIITVESNANLVIIWVN